MIIKTPTISLKESHSHYLSINTYHELKIIVTERSHPAPWIHMPSSADTEPSRIASAYLCVDAEIYMPLESFFFLIPKLQKSLKEDNNYHA